MRLALALVLVASASALAQEKPPADPKAEFEKRWEALAKKTAKEHVTLGKFCTGKKIHEPAHREYTRAAQLDGANGEAQKALGKKQEGGAWVDDAKAAVKTKNEGALSDNTGALAEYDLKRRAAYDKAVKDFEALADFCQKNGMPAEAKDLFKQIVDHYDDKHEKSLLALGWVKEDGRWISPEDAAKRAAAANKVKGAVDGEKVTDPTPVEEKTGWKLTKRKSAHFFLQGFYTDDEMKELIKMGEALRADFLETFEQSPDAFPATITGILLKTQEEHGVYLEKVSSLSESDKKAYKAYAGYPTYKPLSYEVWQGNRDFHYMRDHTVHMSTHLMFWQYAKLKEIPAWMFEGLAYWFSDRITKSALTYCIKMETSDGTGRAFENVLDWKNQIKNSIKESSDPDTRETMEGRLNTMNMKKSVKAWSLIDFMLSKHKPKFFAMIVDMRGGMTQEEALKKHLGVSGYGEFEALWEKFVAENY